MTLTIPRKKPTNILISISKSFVFLIAVFQFTACTEYGGHDSDLESEKQNSNESEVQESHLKYFGFTLIDVYWDDPLDDDAKTNYVDEVASFSNLADILVVKPDDELIERIKAMDDVGVAAVLHVSELFFEQDGSSAPSGHKFKLRSNYAERWAKFVKTNHLGTRESSVAAYYVGEEPTWNGISASELETACDTIKTTLPNSRVMIVEAFPALNELKVPKSADWIGFDHYFIKDVQSSAEFRRELAVLKSKRSSAQQRIILIPDAHFIPKVHQHFGVEKSDLVKIAKDYYQIALEDEDVVALLCYFWPSGFDDDSALGTRQLKDVQAAYQKIGREIVGPK